MELTLPALADRALATLPSRAKFDPLTLVILSALIGEVCVKLVDECFDTLKPKSIRSPGLIRRQLLWPVIRSATCSPRVVAETQGRGWDGARVYRELGGDCYEAVLGLGRGLSDGEIAALKMGLTK